MSPVQSLSMYIATTSQGKSPTEHKSLRPPPDVQRSATGTVHNLAAPSTNRSSQISSSYLDMSGPHSAKNSPCADDSATPPIVPPRSGSASLQSRIALKNESVRGSSVDLESGLVSGSWSTPSTAMRVTGPAVSTPQSSVSLDAMVPLTTDLSESLTISSQQRAAPEASLQVKHRQGVPPRQHIRTNPCYASTYPHEMDPASSVSQSTAGLHASSVTTAGSTVAVRSMADLYGTSRPLAQNTMVSFPPSLMKATPHTGARPKHIANNGGRNKETEEQVLTGKQRQALQNLQRQSHLRVAKHGTSGRPITVHNDAYDESYVPKPQLKKRHWNPPLLGPLPDDFLR